MANVTASWVYQQLTALGVDPVGAAALTAVAGRESGYNPGAFNGNAGTGDKSYGLFQINLLNGGWTSFLQGHGMQNPAQELLTPQGAVKAAAWIYGSSGMHPWGGYKGVSWQNGTDLSAAAAASGGRVSASQLQTFQGNGTGGTGAGAQVPGGPNAGVTAATPALPKFKLPKGGTIYAVDGTLVVLYKVGNNSVYYDFRTVGNQVDTTGTNYGGTLSHEAFTGYNHLVNAGSVTELRGDDVQKAHNYQEWIQQKLHIATGGDTSMLQDPGVVSLLIQSADGSMSDEEITAKLKDTNWWKTRTDSQRQWGKLSPAEKQNRTRDAAASLQDLYFQETGKQIDPADATLMQWATKVASGASSASQASWNWIRPLASKDPQSPWSRQIEQEKESERQQGVDVDNMAGHVQDLYDQWGLKPAKGMLNTWATSIVTKKKSEQDLVDGLKKHAQILYPWKPPEMSTKEAAQPWIDTFDRVMEQQTDLFNPQVQAALTQGQPVYDFEKKLKQSDDWLNTENARNTLTTAASEVGRKLGFIK